MKKVLFIGHYREASGWGQAARDYIQAMLTIKDIDLVCRPLVLKGDYQELPESIKNAENKSDRMPDVCVQHVLPHFSLLIRKSARTLVYLLLRRILSNIQIGRFFYIKWMSYGFLTTTLLEIFVKI